MYSQKFSLNKQDSKESKIALKAILKTQNISYTQNTSNIPLNHLAQFDMILKHV